MNLGRSKNKISRVVGTSFAPKQKKLTFFSVIGTKLVDIVFDKAVYNMKEIN